MNPQVLTQQLNSEQRFILRGISWQQYKTLEAALESIPGVRLAYFHNTLEFMTISEEHEDIKSLIGTLVELFLLQVGMRYYRRGGQTLKKEPDLELMPDESFNFESKKAIPALAIEVVITSGNTEKLEGYKILNVPEVWFWKAGKLSIYSLQDGGYQENLQSKLLPNLDLALLVRCANMADQFDAIAEFRNAIQQQ
ncbi:MAG: Uma2 family endonuclease [Microcoleus vaginatus WJT46-NPBG5]|jgi:Uma2 family endonuclease|nr:Uma2 family endonuclease [Microcoleus vaginatus WJT46-NPBG5]